MEKAGRQRYSIIGSDLDRFVSHEATGVNVIPKGQGMMATRVSISSISPALAERFNALSAGECWPSQHTTAQCPSPTADGQCWLTRSG